MPKPLTGWRLDRIAVDLDDVILDFVGGIRRWVFTEYGVDVPEEKITTFDLKPILSPIIGRNWWTAFRERDWLWPNFDAVPGAIGALEKWRAEGRYLEIVTSKPRWAEYATWKWLGKWRPPVNRVTIVGPDDNKADFSEALLLVDDKVQNLDEWQGKHTPWNGRNVILFDRPHNRTAKEYDIVRAKDWSEVMALVNTLEQNGGIIP